MRLRLLVSEAWRSLAANVSTTFAAMITVLVGMVLLGLFIALGTWTLSWSDNIKHELVVKVEFKTSCGEGRPGDPRAGDRGCAQAQPEPARLPLEVRLQAAGARADEEEPAPS